jgi:type IV pilus assembly protein PilM
MVGIDIGSKTIKIVELKKDGDRHVLAASGIVGYSGNTVEKMVDDKEYANLGNIIKKLHKEAGVSSKEVVISLPEQQVFSRTIKFPLLTDAEISSAVKWESEQYIPIPVNEAIIQHTILSRNETSSPPEVTVLLVAAPRVVVERYTKLISASGLTPVAVETELIALTRSLAPIDKTVIIMDVGASSTDIAIAKNSLLSFSRTIPVAGEAFSRAVSQGLGITEAQAEEYKKTYGLESTQLEGKIKAALEPMLRMLVDEVKKAINFYQTDEKGEYPSAVIISGGTSGMPEIISTLSSLLGLEVVVANPFQRIAVDAETAQKLAPYAPLYSIAVGLAMRE